ncbi:MAG TPA: CaiB/BaiF CoA-transferase family protein [Ferrovibrio sp.]|jgi:crotonobetainyl-CoA:carnitine CoA-transferase CaiB-like acyl-CoA transferase|uniref:CaiB/BaiF CoA transferase family protein n=1 Tax=Ferrovibrio sp. TaxID=1917215 RepID=UPI002ED09903
MGALDGLLVIAIEQAVAAPLCTARLADAGARVIKIERPEGETARNYDSAVHGMSAYFVWLNRGKESAVLDLKAEADRALLFRMLGRADILVQNLAPGAIERLGLTKETLQTQFPRLIAVNIMGYGRQTSYAAMRAYDMLVQAESGICAVTGTPEQPSKIGVSAADIATGMNAHAAILEALIERQKTGGGKSIDIAMFDGMADWMSVPLLHFEHAGRETGRYGLSHASIYPYGPFACRDGSVIVAVQTNAEWKRLCLAVIDRPDLTEHDKCATNALRVANRSFVDAEIGPCFAALSVQDATRRLEKAQIAWGRLSAVSDLPRHPALRRIDVSLPDGTVIRMPCPAGRDSGFKTGPVPALGQQTEQIRAEFSA